MQWHGWITRRTTSEPTDEPDESWTTAPAGAIAVPAIVIGTPSPTIEPAPTADQFRAFPYRPDTVLDGWSTDWLTVRAGSTRGALHRHNGTPRQDDFAAHRLPDGRVIILVADGVSQAPQSHIGATTAVRYAAQWLHTHMPADTADTDWSALVKSTAWALSEQVQALFGLPAPDSAQAEQLLATTLVCAVIEPSQPGLARVHLLSVGDSGAWLLPADQQVPVAILGGKDPSSTLASSTVAGLPRVPANLDPTVLHIEPGDVLLIGTDGIGDPLGSGQGAVGNLLRSALTGPVPPSLLEFGRVVDFSRETFTDDRTLVAASPLAPGPGPAW
ncbi:protein phosphatase 2C domain-containing protein [Mycolicibacterium sp.]|uniref:protein phosphatase 2C domain-containing protein n=1 Tax=Mycolicibacterium sp. TaxID=2320850 RepID=UPI0037C9C1BF